MTKKPSSIQGKFVLASLSSFAESPSDHTRLGQRGLIFLVVQAESSVLLSLSTGHKNTHQLAQANGKYVSYYCHCNCYYLHVFHLLRFALRTSTGSSCNILILIFYSSFVSPSFILLSFDICIHLSV